MATTTTAALAASGATGTLALTGAAVIAGSGSLPVYGAVAPNAAVPGLYIVATPDFVGSWSLSRRPSGMQAVGATDPFVGRLQIIFQADNTLLNSTGAGPIATITASDTVVLTVLAYTSGSIKLTAVQ